MQASNGMPVVVDPNGQHVVVTKKGKTYGLSQYENMINRGKALYAGKGKKAAPKKKVTFAPVKREQRQQAQQMFQSYMPQPQYHPSMMYAAVPPPPPRTVVHNDPLNAHTAKLDELRRKIDALSTKAKAKKKKNATPKQPRAGSSVQHTFNIPTEELFEIPHEGMFQNEDGTYTVDLNSVPDHIYDQFGDMVDKLAEQHTIRIKGITEDPDPTSIELAEQEYPPDTTVVKTNEFVSQLGIRTADYFLTTVFTIDDDPTVTDDPPRVEEEGSENDKYVYASDIIINGSFTFPTSGIYEAPARMISVPYVREVRVDMLKTPSHRFVPKNGSVELLNDYPDALDSLKSTLDYKMWIMSEPPDLRQFEPILEVDEEPPDINIIAEEGPLEYSEFERRVDLKPWNEDKIMIHTNKREDITSNITVVAGQDGVTGTITNEFKEYYGVKRGDYITRDRSDPELVGFFLPDGSVHILGHYAMTNMYYDKDKDSMPERVQDLVGLNHITSGAKYRVTFQWVPSFWVSMSFNSSNNPYFDGNMFTDETISDGTLNYPTKVEINENNLTPDEADYNIWRGRDIHMRGQHKGKYLGRLGYHNQRGLFIHSPVRIPLTRHWEYDLKAKLNIKRFEMQREEWFRAKGLLKMNRDSDHNPHKLQIVNVHAVKLKTHRLGFNPLLLLGKIGAVAKPIASIVNSIIQAVPTAEQRVEYGRHLQLLKVGEEDEMAIFNLPNTISVPNVISKDPDGTVTVDRYKTMATDTPMETAIWGRQAQGDLYEEYPLGVSFYKQRYVLPVLDSTGVIPQDRPPKLKYEWNLTIGESGFGIILDDSGEWSSKDVDGFNISGEFVIELSGVRQTHVIDNIISDEKPWVQFIKSGNAWTMIVHFSQSETETYVREEFETAFILGSLIKQEWHVDQYKQVTSAGTQSGTPLSGNVRFNGTFTSPSKTIRMDVENTVYEQGDTDLVNAGFYLSELTDTGSFTRGEEDYMTMHTVVENQFVITKPEKWTYSGILDHNAPL